MIINNDGNQTHDSLVAVSNKLFALLTEKLNVNTAYVAKKDAKAMTVINSFNHKEEIVSNHIVVDYEESNCRLVLESPESLLHVPNLLENSSTRTNKINEVLNVKAFLGVALNGRDGHEFGTLCVLDKEEKVFSEQDIEFLKNIADILSFMIELDEAYQDLELLSVPFIPLSKGLAILALQGNVSQTRANRILEDTLLYATNHKIHHFIIDLSEIQKTDQFFSNLLNRLVSALKLMGTQVVFSGIPFKLTYESTLRDLLQELDVEYVRNIDDAFNRLGYQLTKLESV
ncbi:GAF domain-containing protein [Alkalihalobacillus trypoxylicola]|uniref:STAS domain-containing protein n=1 Tax=Alkalihalobacillus trypoxylicola TaxID=519424 RepID=A0A162EDC3_9BACI|nr:GAF domain-containing protein [Alkalihalobacillus trypoxylicola]KYG32323.1 hypothetical protein AZF04_06045 [Alkalihalobacillus trypoxylicola]